MQLKVALNLNPNTTIELDFSGGDIQDVIREAMPLLDFDPKCGFCDSNNLSLVTRETKEGYKYTEYVCKDCKATKPWGKFQDGRGFYLKNWQEPFSKK